MIKNNMPRYDPIQEVEMKMDIGYVMCNMTDEQKKICRDIMIGKSYVEMAKERGLSYKVFKRKHLKPIADAFKTMGLTEYLK